MIRVEPTFRLAILAEATAIAELSRDLIEYGLRWRWTPDRVGASIRAANVNVLVATAAKQIAGFAIMRYGDDDAHLDLLAVEPAFQRAGIGGQMVRWLEKCAVVAGIFNVELEVRTNNHGAQRFYETLGYSPLKEMPGYYQGIETALRMRHDLAYKSPD
jgi:ribosomal-protein-alanine N-acetyltransferase